MCIIPNEMMSLKSSSKHSNDQLRSSPCISNAPCLALQCSELIASRQSNISTAVLWSDALRCSQQCNEPQSRSCACFPAFALYAKLCSDLMLYAAHNNVMSLGVALVPAFPPMRSMLNNSDHPQICTSCFFFHFWDPHKLRRPDPSTGEPEGLFKHIMQNLGSVS